MLVCRYVRFENLLTIICEIKDTQESIKYFSGKRNERVTLERLHYLAMTEALKLSRRL